MLTKPQTPLKIAILGGKSTGKSAISVRFLTKRYIGDYSSDTDHLYQCPINCAQVKGAIELLDITGDCLNKNQEEINEILNWANGFMVVYSVCDRHSFSQCFRLLNEIARISPQTSLVVVGNKQDLEAGRKIEFEEGKSLAAKFCAQFFEISAADHCFGATKAFEGLLQLASKSPRLFSKNPLVLCTVSNNIVSRHPVKKPHERIVFPFHLIGSVITATQRKYSFSKKNRQLVKQSFSSQSSDYNQENDMSTLLKTAVKSRSHSAPQFLIPRRKEHFYSLSDCKSSNSVVTTPFFCEKKSTDQSFNFVKL